MPFAKPYQTKAGWVLCIPATSHAVAAADHLQRAHASREEERAHHRRHAQRVRGTHHHLNKSRLLAPLYRGLLVAGATE